MTNGNLSIGRAPNYEDYPSLKKYVKSQNHIWSSQNLSRFIFNQAGTNSLVEVEEKGGLTIADIAAEGACYCWEESDVAADRGKVVTMEYLDDAGEIHTGYATLNATTTTECQFMTTSGGATPIADFYRRRSLEFEQIAGKYIAIGATGKGTVYGVIEEGYHLSLHSRYTVPANRDAWIARIIMTVSVATKIVTQLKITFVPYGHTEEHNVIISVGDFIEVDPFMRLAANTDVKFEILGNLTDNTFNLHIIEAIQR